MFEGVLHLAKLPFRNGRLIFLDGRLALQGVSLRLKGTHPDREALETVAFDAPSCPSQQFEPAFLTVLVPFSNSCVRTTHPTTVTTSVKNECGEFDAVL